MVPKKAKELIYKIYSRFKEIYPEFESEEIHDCDKVVAAVKQLRDEKYISSTWSRKKDRITHCWKCWNAPLISSDHKECPVCTGIICPKCGACHQDCKENGND